MILEAEGPRILADYFYIVPTKTCESLLRYFTKRRRKVDKVNAGEEFGDIDVFGHRFDVPTCAASDLQGSSGQVNYLNTGLWRLTSTQMRLGSFVRSFAAFCTS